MKKICTIAVLMILCGPGLSAQVVTGSKSVNNKNTPVSLVPAKVHQKFLLENPEVKARWKTDNGVYTAQYINPLNNMGYMITYDSLGTVLHRDKELENQEYPAAINDFFIKEYPGEGYVIWSSVDAAGNQLFYTDHDSRIFKFDKNGRLLNPVKSNIRSLDSIAAPTTSN